MIPLGILAASGIQPAAAGSYDLLATEILTSSQASVTFSSLGDYAADYQHLQIRMTARSTRSSTDSYLHIRFNGDTAYNYSSHYLVGTGSSVVSGGDIAAYEDGILDINFLTANTATADSFGASVVDVLDPFETTKYITTRTLSGQASSNFQQLGLSSGSWRNTASLTSITLDDALGASFAADSRFSLYGLKASA